MRTWAAFVVWLAVIALCVPSAFGQQPSDTINEAWPELQVYFRLNPRTQLFLDVAGQSDRESSYSNGLIGGDVIYEVNKWMDARAGYRFGRVLDSNSKPTFENRMLFQTTPHASLGHGWFVNDRNRIELRWLDTGFSTRYRNKLQFGRDFKVRERAVTPYVETEVFYDSRYEKWNRVVYDAGVAIAINKRFSIEPYAGEQSDTETTPRYTRFLGLKFILRF